MNLNDDLATRMAADKMELLNEEYNERIKLSDGGDRGHNPTICKRYLLLSDVCVNLMRNIVCCYFF